MDKFLLFLSNHYILLIVVTVFLLFALIGYFAKKNDGSIDSIDERPDKEIDFSNIKVDGNVSLNDVVRSESINPGNSTPTLNTIGAPNSVNTVNTVNTVNSTVQNVSTVPANNGVVLNQQPAVQAPVTQPVNSTGVNNGNNVLNEGSVTLNNNPTPVVNNPATPAELNGPITLNNNINNQ